MRKKSSRALPIPVRNALRKLGRDIRDARLRRRVSTVIMANRALIDKVVHVDRLLEHGAYCEWGVPRLGIDTLSVRD